MSQKLATVWVLQDNGSELFFNRGRLEDWPAVYTEGQAKRFQTQHTGRGIGATLNGSSTHLATCDLEVIECNLVKKR